MNVIRKLQFMVKGYRNFTKNQNKMPALQGYLEGKNYIITGANSGIGLEAARFAAKKQANVFLVCRNQKRGEEAVEVLIKESGNQNVHLIIGQMGEKESLIKISKQIHEKVERVDFLVLNAGCMLHKPEYTKDGMQKNFATNTFSIYYLTKLCFPLMDQNSRVIITSSGGMYTQKLITEDLFMQKEEFDGTTQYARNKRQQICIAEQFAKKHPNKGLFLVMHPGWVDTPAVREAMPDFYNKMKGKLKESPEGADTINYLTMTQKNKLKNGEFYYDRQIANKHLLISCTTYSSKQSESLMKKLEDFAEK